MLLSVFLLLAGTAFAGAPQKVIGPSAEETLHDQLLKLRHRHDWEVRQSIFEGAEDLRDAVTSSAGPAKVKLADRLPGMAQNPFEICLDLYSCPRAPTSLHVDDTEKIDDAFVALARPWIKLQEARGKEVTTVVEHGVGVQVKLEDFPQQPVVTLTAEPAETGGFDVASDAGPAAAKAFAAERDAVLKSKGN